MQRRSGHHHHLAQSEDNGTVLIAGGYDDQTDVIHSLEIFDPASASFKPL
jgi:hypothetical protein